jgi:hypothetical protein
MKLKHIPLIDWECTSACCVGSGSRTDEHGRCPDCGVYNITAIEIGNPHENSDSGHRIEPIHSRTERTPERVFEGNYRESHGDGTKAGNLR